MTPYEIFRSQHPRGVNIMTPEFIEIGALPNGAYELSTGRGLSCRIWGVTVVRLRDGHTECDREASGCFLSLAAARRHIAKLKGLTSAADSGSVGAEEDSGGR